MPELQLEGRCGPVPTWVERPTGAGPWPGVVVIHDANGMSEDLRSQARWLAGEGFLAAAPDLYRGGAKVRCMVRVIREVSSGRDGAAMDALDAARGWLLEQEGCSGRVGVIGFCMGGGFAWMLAVRGRHDAASVNYGTMTPAVEEQLARACPVVASFGGRDPTLRGEAERVQRRLRALGVVHDVKEYPAAGHGFMNSHRPGTMPWLFVLLARASRTRFDPSATADARQRIVAFFREHLA